MENSQVLDTQYVMRSQNSQPVWKGISSSQISWNERLQRWELFNRFDKILLASTKPGTEFPFGENRWRLEAENICIDQHRDQELTLMFSKCSKLEYSCSDGSCIPISLKCNYVPECWDGGDEENCTILSLEGMRNYDSFSPNVWFDKQGNIGRAGIKIGVNITHIEEINEVKSRFSTSLILSIKWKEYRATWKDLNDESSLNYPSSEEKSLLWFPKVIFDNSEDHLEVPNDSNAQFVIEKKGNATMSDQFELRETAYFTGRRNPILFSRELHLKLKCDFKLNYFPFDTQVCLIVMVPGYKEKNFIKFRGESVHFTGEKELLTFDVVHTEFKTTDNKIEVRIHLKRQIAQYVLGIYVPSLFIMVAAQVGATSDNEIVQCKI